MGKVPQWVPVVAATVVLVGSAVAAAALTSGSSPSEPSGFEFAEEPTTTSTEPVTTTVPESDGPTSDVPADDPSDASESGTPRYWGPECGENPTNHGGYVARAEKSGVSRREAAHSPCGKPLTSVEAATTTTTTTAPIAELPEPVGDAPVTTQGPSPQSGHAPPPHGNGGGQGNGKGQGNGHGNGQGH